MTARHWDDVYSGKAARETSWFEPEATTSRRLIAGHPIGSGVPRTAIDVGAGRSPLAAALIADGWQVTVLDCSAVALASAPEGARRVVSDVLAWEPGPAAFGAWHDRAVLHFLVDEADRRAYAAIASRAVAPGGIAVIGCFAPDGPEQCSGLPVRRASADELAALLDGGFALEHAEQAEHVTPWDARQAFTWVVLRRR